jgi:hypothetical protein
VITATVVVLVWHFYFEDQYHEQRAAVVQGVLTPERAPLDNRAIIRATHDSPEIGFISDNSGPSSLPPGVYRPELKVSEGSNGVILTTSVKDRGGNLVAAVKGNHWYVYPPYTSEKNYTKNSLEVKDSSGEVVLQIFLKGSTAYVQGIWRDQFGAGAEILSDENEKESRVISWANSGEERQKEQPISPSFVYPSPQHWGEKIPKMTVDDFNSSQYIDVVNKSGDPLVVLKATGDTVPQTSSYSRDLNVEIGPHETKRIKFSEYLATPLPPTLGSYNEQWEAAKDTYKNCAGMLYFGATNQDAFSIVQWYRKTYQSLPNFYADGVGELTYKFKGSQTVFKTHFTIIAFVTKINGCPP